MDSLKHMHIEDRTPLTLLKMTDGKDGSTASFQKSTPWFEVYFSLKVTQSATCLIIDAVDKKTKEIFKAHLNQYTLLLNYNNISRDFKTLDGLFRHLQVNFEDVRVLQRKQLQIQLKACQYYSYELIFDVETEDQEVKWTDGIAIDLIPHPSSINKEQFKITKHKKGKRLQKISPGDHWTAFVLKDPVLVGEIGRILVELQEIKNNQIMLGACSEQYTGGFYFKKCHQCVTCDFRKGDVWKMGESQCYPDLKFNKGDKILMEVNLINKQIKFNEVSIKIPPKLCNAPLFYYLVIQKQGDTVRLCPVE